MGTAARALHRSVAVNTASGKRNFPMPLAIALGVAAAVAVTAAVAALVGIPMVRCRDIYLAIVTMALVVAGFITPGNLWPG